MPEVRRSGGVTSAIMVVASCTRARVAPPMSRAATNASKVSA